MVKIYVNGLEIETERYVEEGPECTIKDLNGVIELMDSKETPAEFSDFFVRNEGDLYA